MVQIVDPATAADLMMKSVYRSAQRKTEYPFQSLEVGSAFLIKCDGNHFSQYGNQRTRLYAQSKRLAPQKFSITMIEHDGEDGAGRYFMVRREE